MDDHNLVKNTLDQIPQANSDAKRIVGLVKEGGRITGYQLSDNHLQVSLKSTHYIFGGFCFTLTETTVCFSPHRRRKLTHTALYVSTGNPSQVML